MNQWHIPTWWVASVIGALLFLKLVADQLELTASELRSLERRRRRASQRGREGQDAAVAGKPASREPFELG